MWIVIGIVGIAVAWYVLSLKRQNKALISFAAIGKAGLATARLIGRGGLSCRAHVYSFSNVFFDGCV